MHSMTYITTHATTPERSTMPTTPIQMNANEMTKPSFTVRYDQTTVAHTKQFVVCAGDEELLLECSSGLIGGGGDTHELPIHTRLALPWTAAERLHELLGQVLQRHKAHHACGTRLSRVADRNTSERSRAAGLPKFGAAQ